MSKSEGNYVGVAEAPEEQFGKLMRIPDEVMPTYYDLLLGGGFDPGRPAVESKRALGRAIVERFHGERAAEEAEAHFNRLHVDHALPDDIEEAELPSSDPVHLPALLRDHFGISSSEARRLLAGGGVRLDGEQLSGGDLDVPAERLAGRVLQVGKRRHKRFRGNGSAPG
jgi:tyrosyl-tRNA synthetase